MKKWNCIKIYLRRAAIIVFFALIILLFISFLVIQSFSTKEQLEFTFHNFSLIEKMGLEVISKYSQAKYLDISYTNISDISFARNMKSLKTMYIAVSRVPISDWSFLPECEQLERFTGVNTNFEDLSPLSSNVNLKKINLFDGNPIKNIDDVTSFKNLNELYISSYDLYDITPLENMENLEYLYIAYSNIDNIEPLSKCTKLKKISLAGNKNIVNISPISTLKNLESINLVDTSVSDFKPLLNLSNLQTIVVCENSMTEDEKALFSEKGINIKELSCNNCHSK